MTQQGDKKIKIRCPRCGAWQNSVAPDTSGVLSYHCSNRVRPTNYKCDTYFEVHATPKEHIYVILPACPQTVYIVDFRTQTVYS